MPVHRNPDRPNPEKFAELAEVSHRFGASEDITTRLNIVITMFGYMAVENLAELLLYTHLH